MEENKTVTTIEIEETEIKVEAVGHLDAALTYFRLSENVVLAACETHEGSPIDLPTLDHGYFFVKGDGDVFLFAGDYHISAKHFRVALFPIEKNAVSKVDCRQVGRSERPPYGSLELTWE